MQIKITGVQKVDPGHNMHFLVSMINQIGGPLRCGGESNCRLGKYHNLPSLVECICAGKHPLACIIDPTAEYRTLDFRSNIFHRHYCYERPAHGRFWRFRAVGKSCGKQEAHQPESGFLYSTYSRYRLKTSKRGGTKQKDSAGC